MMQFRLAIWRIEIYACIEMNKKKHGMKKKWTNEHDFTQFLQN